MENNKRLKNFVRTTFRGLSNESENKDFILNNDNVKKHTWTSNGKEYSFNYYLSYDIFGGLYTANLLGGEFDNTYGEGETEEGAVRSLKLRLIQLRNKRDEKNF
jgi:hypothetical protein